MQYARDDDVVPAPVSGAGPEPGRAHPRQGQTSDDFLLIRCMSFPNFGSVIGILLITCS